jgi:alpha-glucosidase/alpha-D-xyloside xylohydrolase
MQLGVDGFWPDEGDWFNLFERIKRHQLYYQGMLSHDPNARPWSLQRNGYPGIAQWGGWVWSGDTDSSWKSLEAQIAVGLNYSMSVSPFWGSDIGGFYSNPELTGELYARWVQFAAFTPSFRGHGRTWMMRLPWGWGKSSLGPIEMARGPLESELFNKAIEPIAKHYIELRYRLLPYNYTLAWEARQTGMPMMRAMWMHYPGDETAKRLGDQYMWGANMVIAPVYEKGAVSRDVYLPAGQWYDWWTNEPRHGGSTVTKEVDLSMMPIYVRAGTILPVDPVRQFADEKIEGATTLRIYSGADGSFTFYDDDGISQEYLTGKGNVIDMMWDQKQGRLNLAPAAGSIPETTPRTFIAELLPGGTTREITYSGKAVSVILK